MKDCEALAPQHFIKPNLKSNIYTKEEGGGGCGNLPIYKKLCTTTKGES
jgi:hypothetical protein